MLRSCVSPVVDGSIPRADLDNTGPEGDRANADAAAREHVSNKAYQQLAVSEDEAVHFCVAVGGGGSVHVDQAVVHPIGRGDQIDLLELAEPVISEGHRLTDGETEASVQVALHFEGNRLVWCGVVEGVGVHVGLQ